MKPESFVHRLRQRLRHAGDPLDIRTQAQAVVQPFEQIGREAAAPEENAEERADAGAGAVGVAPEIHG